jgi:hypothetical protein
MPDKWVKVVGGCGLLLSLTVQADWAGFAGYQEVAEIAVEPSEIRLNVRLAASAVPPHAAAAAANAAPDWLAEKLPVLQGKEGQGLIGKFLYLNPAEAETAKGGKQSYIEAALTYPSAQLESIQIAPPAGLSTGLVVMHRGVPVADLVPLRTPLKLALDWADPWHSHFDQPEFVRRHASPRSYVYIEPYEVRHEVLMRLQDFKPWLDLGLKDPRYVEDSERDALKHKLGAFLLGHNPLLIDGAAVTPLLDRVEFLCFSRAGLAPIAEPGRLEANTVLVGVMLSYLTEAPAHSLSVEWDLFGGEVETRQISLAEGKETFDGYMNAKTPRFEWSQEELLEPIQTPDEGPKLPAAVVKLDNEHAKALLQALLHNAYRAFQLRDEEKAYDRLAKSLDGDLLDDIYLQQRSALLRAAQGLAGESKVDRIEVLESRVLPTAAAGAWQVDARWLAHGSVSHWGHSHERHNLYQARLSLRPEAGGQWRIIGLQFTGGQRLEPAAS